MRLRHLADDDMPAAVLRAVEKGRHPLTPTMIAGLAGRYEADLAELLPTRETVIILATGTIAAGGLDESFLPDDADSMLGAYLRLIGRLRGETGVGALALRRDDIVNIADQLGRPRPEIVDKVGLMLGASPAERRAMVDLYLAGATVVGVTG